MSAYAIYCNGFFSSSLRLRILTGEQSISAYRTLIEKIERLTNIFGMAMMITLLFLALPIFLYTIINYFIFDLGDESFILFFPAKFVSSLNLKKMDPSSIHLISFNCRWPFDWKTPLGYLIAWLIQSVACAIGAITTTVFFYLIFGSCWLFIYIAEDTTKDLAAFNSDITSNAWKKRPESMKSFCEIVQLYTDAKQYGFIYVPISIWIKQKKPKKFHIHSLQTCYWIQRNFPISTFWAILIHIDISSEYPVDTTISNRWVFVY